MDFSNAEIFLNIKISPYLYSALAGACSESIGQGREKSNHENLEGKESEKNEDLREHIDPIADGKKERVL